MYNKTDTSFPLKESKSALKNFCDTDRLHRNYGFDPDLFLVKVEQSLTNLINRRQYKVKLILSCMMEKVDINDNEAMAKAAAFHSKTEVNLESTNCKELFSKIKDIVLIFFSKISKTRKLLDIPFSSDSGPSHCKV